MYSNEYYNNIKKEPTETDTELWENEKGEQEKADAEETDKIQP